METAISTPPHNPEAEIAVLGALLIDPEAFHDVADILERGAGEFYQQAHGHIWRSIAHLSEQRIPIDLLTVCQELERQGRLEEIGGAAYIMGLINRTPTSLHAAAYARIVRDQRVRREILRAAGRAAQLAYDLTTAIEQTSAQVMTVVSDAVAGVAVGQARGAAQLFSDLYDLVDDRSRQPAGRLPGVASGFSDLDRLLGGGFQQGALNVIGGRPGQGKTSFLLSVLYNAAYQNQQRIALFSLEMSSEENGERLLAMSTKLDGQKIHAGKIGEDEWAQFTHGVEVGARIAVTFDDTPAINPVQLRARCKRIQAQTGLDLVILDYLGLMSPDRPYENRTQEVSYLSRSLKALARELSVPILAAHQLSRAVELRADQKPQLSDLRDSGSIEQDADVILLIYPDKDNANLTHLDLAKHRNGPTGGCNLIFRRNLTRFENAAPATGLPHRN